MANKISLGDIFKIKTKKGNAYFQYVKEPVDSSEVEKIKVFYSFYSEGFSSYSELLKEDFFYIGFPLKAAVKKNLVEKVFNIDLPNGYKFPTLFRCENFLGEGWNIVNIETDDYIEVGVTKLNKEQLQLSPDEVWNDTLLKENLERGWRLDNWK